ncbi:unnamed protein product [Calypogeia fissa]
MDTMKCCLLLVLLYAIPVMAKTTVFHTNCTGPPSGSRFNFVTAPNKRGTLEILWSCLLTWQVQHLNVPPQGMSRGVEFWRKLSSMLKTLLVPEALVAVAFADFTAARRSVMRMQKQFPGLGGWTMTHAFYANMGGFILKTRDDIAIPLVVDSERMITYLQSLPSPTVLTTERDIQRKAKGDIFLKCLAAMQVIWFVVQVIAREVEKLPISQLEIAVLAFAMCTLVIYALWAEKPQDVSEPIVLDALSAPTLLQAAWVDDRSASDRLDDYNFDSAEIKVPALGVGIESGFLGLSLGGTVFGAIHLLAWNLSFPTHLEKTLWRISSITSTTIPFVMLLFFVNGEWFKYPVDLPSINKEINGTILGTIVGTIISLYIICRLYILVEIFRSLGFLSAGTFVTTWSTYIPHIT